MATRAQAAGMPLALWLDGREAARLHGTVVAALPPEWTALPVAATTRTLPSLMRAHRTRNELGRGNVRSHTPMPYLLAGGAGGAFPTGRFLKYNGDPHNNLLVSLMSYMGAPAKTFGDPNFCTGALTQL